jgi:hypothetical protein
LALSCKDQGKQLSTQYYNRPNISAQEIRTPESVIHETIDDKNAVIDYPLIKSPAMQYENEIPTTQILNDLLTSEKVARRQYDELLMNPELKLFVLDLLHIRGEEHEHEKILECINQRLQSPNAAQKPINWNEPHATAKLLKRYAPESNDITLTPKGLGELYVTILDRFAEEEQKFVRNYEDFLVKVQQSREALKQSKLAGDAYGEVATPLIELEIKINKHLNEERVHLDVVNAMRDMFSNMKLGNVY